MIAVVRAELAKVVTARSSLVVCLLAVGLAYLIAVISGLVGDYSGSASPGRDLADLGQLTFFFVMVIGVLSIGGEFRHGSIAPSLLVTPSRSKLLAGKAIAVVIISVAICVITVVGCVLIGAVTLPTQDFHLHLSSSDFLEAVLETAAVAPIWALVGLGVGALLRNQTGAIVLLLAWIFVVEGIVGSLFSGYAPYAFGNAVGVAAGADAGVDNPLTQGASFAVCIGYAGVLTLAGWLIFERSDVTG